METRPCEWLLLQKVHAPVRHVKVWSDRFLTVLVQEELVEAQAAGLFADEAMHVLSAVVVNSDGVFQRLHAGLQTEGNFGVADSVPAKDKCFTALPFLYLQTLKVYFNSFSEWEEIEKLSKST